MDEMKKTAETALKKCLKLKENEDFIVITDKKTQEIGEAFYRAGEEKTEETYLLKVPEQELGETEPPELAGRIMEETPADVIVIPTQSSYSHTEAREKANKKGTRIATLPGITEEIFKRTIDIDYKKLRKEGKKLKKKLEKASKARIKTSSGTNLNLKLSNKVIPDLGQINEPGTYGNLPTGEVFTAPDKKEVNGKIVIDSMQDIAKPKTKVLVQNGEAQDVEGDKEFKEKLWRHENGRNIAEFGIGLNPNATLTGNILEDEKVKGTCHIAFGKNKDFGGKVDSKIHWDAILIQPDIWLDEEKLMEEGELIL